MGFFSSLGIEKYDRQYSDRHLVRRMGTYFRSQTRRMIGIAILLLLVAIASAAVPILVSRTIDELKGDVQTQTILLLGGAVLFSGVFVWGANWARRRWVVRAINDVMLDIRLDAFRAAATLDLSFYDEFSSGRIVSRITSDTREFGQVVNLITDLASQFIQAFILSIMLVSLESKLMLYLFGFLPLVFLVALGFRRVARRVTQRGMRAMGNVNAAIKETVSGIGVAKNYRQEGTIFNEFDDANQSSFRVNLQRGLVLSLIFPSLNAISGVGTAMLLYVGGWEAAKGAVTVGAWFLFIQSLNQFWWPLLNLSAFLGAGAVWSFSRRARFRSD